MKAVIRCVRLKQYEFSIDFIVLDDKTSWIDIWSFFSEEQSSTLPSSFIIFSQASNSFSSKSSIGEMIWMLCIIGAKVALVVVDSITTERLVRTCRFAVCTMPEFDLISLDDFDVVVRFEFDDLNFELFDFTLTILEDFDLFDDGDFWFRADFFFTTFLTVGFVDFFDGDDFNALALVTDFFFLTTLAAFLTFFAATGCLLFNLAGVVSFFGAFEACNSLDNVLDWVCFFAFAIGFDFDRFLRISDDSDGEKIQNWRNFKSSRALCYNLCCTYFWL